MRKTKPVIAVSDLSNWEFGNSFYHQSKPVVIKNAMADSLMMKKWNPDYLKEKIGKKSVDVITSVNMKNEEKGLYNYNKAGIKVINCPFTEIADLFTSQKYSNGEYYLAASSIPDYFPELLPDVSLPRWASPNDVQVETNLWFGCEGCISHLHYDKAQNFLLQVSGSKELLLFAPEELPYMYQDVHSDHPELSKANLQSIDYNEFPLLAKTQPYHCIIEPGDLLFLPMNWWHQVTSLNPCISINFWWHRFELIEDSEMTNYDTQTLRLLINEFLKNGVKIDQPDYQGESMLVKAVEYDYPNVVEALLELGADPNGKSNSYRLGETAQELAKIKGNRKIVQLFESYFNKI